MDNITISGGNVVIRIGEASKKIDLPYPVRVMLITSNACVVCLETQPGKVFNENILGLDRSGEIIWIIEAARHVYPDSPYTEIHLDSDPRFVWASNWDGAKRKIDVVTGQTVVTLFAK